MKKIKELRKELLENYFTLDGNVATLKLIYDSFIELVNLNFGDEKVEKLNDKLFSDISEAISLLPRNYKLNLEIVIKDFGNYQKEECEKIIRNNLYLIGYQAIKRNNRKKITGYTLIGIGAAILIVSYFLRKYDLWFDLINISGTLFVWEGVDIAFIERNMENSVTRKLAKTLNRISIVGQ